MALTKDQIDRYSRHILLKEVGGQGQQKLLSAKVLVIGAGGIGHPIIQYLAAAGVGTIGIADDDHVEISNLQRQILFTPNDIGKPKTECVARSVCDLNPDVSVHKHQLRVGEDNIAELIAPYDVVVEGIDNFKGRFVINRACIAQKKPLISAAIGRFDGQVTTFKSFEDPGTLPCYRCLVPEEPPRDEQVSCSEVGVIGAIAGVVGTLAAMEVLKEILMIGQSLAGRISIYNGLSGETRLVTLPADPACEDCAP